MFVVTVRSFITVKIYVVKVPFGTRKVELYLFVIAVNSV